MNAHTTFIDTMSRRFERGFSTDFTAMQNFLASHGVKLFAIHANRQTASYRLKYGDEKPIAVKWSGVIDHVDDIRISLGLEPIRRRA